MTDILDGLSAVFVAALLLLVVVHLIRTRAEPTETAFLTKIYVWTVLIRFSLAIVLNALAANSAFAAAFWGDSSTYDAGGQQLSLKWSGEPIASTYITSTAVSGYGWTHFVGAVYYVFGRNQLLVQFFNGIMGGLTVIVIYAIASQLFDRAVARWAALFMAFFPQMVFWSTGMYKDPAILLCIALAMYAVVRLRERLLFSLVLLFTVAVVALITLRFYVAYFVLFASFATFVFNQRRDAARTLITYGLLALVLFGALTVAVKRETLEQQTTYLTLERLQITREDQATWGRSRFGQEYDVSTPTGAIATLPIGLAYLLFAPFPWAISGFRQALAVPETLVWYALMPAFARGIIYALRTRLREILPIVVFAVSLTGAYALMQGNVGTAYRQRTQVTMFFFVFMGVGIVEGRRRRAQTAGAEAYSTLGRQR
jgi:4-amino-4-deoxy-L-arabinose transferase-like glycosyltransferase